MSQTELTATINDLLRQTGASRQRCHAMRGQAELLGSQKVGLEEKQAAAEDEQTLLEKAQEVLYRLEAEWRGKYEVGLAGLGSRGLNAVFVDDEYEVLLESTTKRGATSLDIVLSKNGQRVRLKGGSGGSVIQVLAYILRHITTTTHRPTLRSFEVLDEPFSQVAAEQRPALCAMVKDITQRLSFQSLISSHETELLDAADVAYHVRAGGKLELLKSVGEDRS